MCSSRKYPCLSLGRDFFLRPPNPLEIPLKFHTYIKTFWSYRTSHPQEIPIPSVGGGGRRGSIDVFWNYTL